MKTETKQNVNIGVDTGKFQLDIYIRPLGTFFSVSNDEKGIKEAVNEIKRRALLLKPQDVLKFCLLWLVQKPIYRS